MLIAWQLAGIVTSLDFNDSNKVIVHGVVNDLEVEEV